MTDTENTENKIIEAQNPEVVTQKQTEACDKVVASIKRLTGRMLQDYWAVGKIVEDVIVAAGAEDPEQNPFGKGAMQYISGQTKHSVAELYRMNTVFKRYSEEQIAQLTDAGLGITNVVEAAKIVDDKARMKLLLEAAKEATTVKEFKEVVDKVAESKENQKALKEESGKEQKGVKSRPGTGREGSPLTPVKQAGSLSEKLSEIYKNAILPLKEFEGTDKQQQNLTDAAEFAAGVIVDLLGNAVGFAEVLEEYLAVNQGDGRRRRSQGSRKDGYDAVLTALQGFVKGYDKTLVAGEKVRKELDEAEANERAKEKEEREKAKEAIREKAKARAEKKTEKKVEKKEKKADDAPAASSATQDRLAALRARALKMAGKK
jgi:hypothetical protein